MPCRAQRIKIRCAACNLVYIKEIDAQNSSEPQPLQGKQYALHVRIEHAVRGSLKRSDMFTTIGIVAAGVNKYLVSGEVLLLQASHTRYHLGGMDDTSALNTTLKKLNGQT
jgi:hypothetical protein